MCGRQGLDRRDVAACDFPPVIDDQDVVAERLRLVQDLRRQDDRSAAARLGPEQLHHRPLEDRVHPGRELVEKHDGRIHEQRLGDLDPPAKPATQIHRLARGILHEAELLHHIVGPRAQRFPFNPWNRPERQQVVANAEEDLRGAFLHHDDDLPADGERIPDHVDSGDFSGA